MSDHKPTAYPTKYLCQYLVDEDIEVIIFYACMVGDTCAIWLHIFTAVGSAVHGDAQYIGSNFVSFWPLKMGYHFFDWFDFGTFFTLP